jgi:hypothetical protein
MNVFSPVFALAQQVYLFRVSGRFIIPCAYSVFNPSIPFQNVIPNPFPSLSNLLFSFRGGKSTYSFLPYQIFFAFFEKYFSLFFPAASLFQKNGRAKIQLLLIFSNLYWKIVDKTWQLWPAPYSLCPGTAQALPLKGFRTSEFICQ